ncbi:hypothetical protein ACFQ6N_12950 [Kitasatospora sp. NPDC056446]|uniref:hypothetical protein n=1 Tax=Kitasatospora sp. NPDC056446 TaxID=3345819 RepID=UPI0036C27E55
MSQDRSADPFSTFLNSTGRQVSAGQQHISVGGGVSDASTDAVPPVAVRVLVELLRRPRTPLAELRVTTGLTTLEIAEVVSMLLRLGLVEARRDGGDDEVELTPRGRALLDSR